MFPKDEDIHHDLASPNLAESALGISGSRYDSGNAYAKDVQCRSEGGEGSCAWVEDAN